MQGVASIAAQAGHPDKAFALADDADALIRTLPPPTYLDAASRRWTTPAAIRAAAILALARQGKFQDALAELEKHRAHGLTDPTHTTHDTNSG